ncbi:histidine kinase [Nonomuraea sp. NPDC050786]|uniref:sensor histidine kinase n=1 Tax=Nonomuraea sp. NPDC050786 TaxID=3154840 RepID=UPI0033CB20F9
MDTTAIAARWRRAWSALPRADGTPPHLPRRSWVFDALVMLCVLAYGLQSLSAYTAVRMIGRQVIPIWVTVLPSVSVHHQSPAIPPVQVAVEVVLSTFPLALRRRFPLSVFVVAVGAKLLYHVSGGLEPTFAVLPAMIAAYSALVYSPHRIAAVTSVMATAVIATFGGFGKLPPIPSALLPIVVIVPAGLAFSMINTWKQRAEAAREKLRALQAEQQAAARSAVERERARLAGELHDVVTHNVSVMVIQAGAARMALESDLDQAREALRAVETGGRAAMSELRYAMGLLTMDSDPAAEIGMLDTPANALGTDISHDHQPTAADLAPQPGLAQAPALVERLRRTGVPIELTVTGTPVALLPGADLAAYRVVQEALTNTVKHAHSASVKISLAYSPTRLTVEVADTGGVPTASANSGTGHGLTGLRERLAVYHGTLHAAERPTGGFRVRAVIPIEAPHRNDVLHGPASAPAGPPDDAPRGKGRK